MIAVIAGVSCFLSYLNVLTYVMTRGYCSGMEPVKTPQRSIRIPDRIWHAAQEKARSRGERVSDVVRQALIKYIEEER